LVFTNSQLDLTLSKRLSGDQAGIHAVVSLGETLNEMPLPLSGSTGSNMWLAGGKSGAWSTD